MKVSILCANCMTPILQQVVDSAQHVLQELEIEIEVIDLNILPYYKEGELSPLAQVMANKLADSKGIIGITSVHVAGMHSSMQSFFEHIERYTECIAQTPLLAITYTTGLGERQATYQMLQAWNMLGGSDGGYLALNNNMPEDYIAQTVEKAIEGFYRLLKQERISYVCSEALAIKRLSNMLDTAIDTVTKEHKEQAKHINLSTQEQNIQEFADLLKSQVSYGQEDFVHTNASTYTNPMVNPSVPKPTNGLARLPHYFLAQHAKDLDLTIQYIISSSRQQGHITIKDGDCTYEEGTLMSPMLEITLTEELLQQLMSKKITYQKAFMVGKIKVRGNFVLLPKLDQIFKEI